MKLIGITGMSGSGKSNATSYLASLGYNVIYFGKVILDEIEKKNLELTPQNEELIREELREKYGMNAIAKYLLDDIRKSNKHKNTVLDGVYSFDEYKLLKEEFKDDFKLIAVVSDKDIRYDRVSTRVYRKLTRDEILKRDYEEIEELGKGGTIAIADYYVNNNGSIENFNKRLKEIIEGMDK